MSGEVTAHLLPATNFVVSGMTICSLGQGCFLTNNRQWPNVTPII
jgi:hypothetical protein